MNRLRIACLLVVALAALAFPVRAQESGLSVSLERVYRLSDAAERGFVAGDRLEARFTLRNEAERPLALRRIVLLLADGFRLAEAGEDLIDNDSDGETDEPDEAFQRLDGEDAVWRFEDGARIAPGEILRRTIRLVALESLTPGAEASLTVSVGTTRFDEANVAPRRWRETFPLAMLDPALKLRPGLPVQTAFGRFVLTLEARLPPGRIPDARLELPLPAAIEAPKIASFIRGVGVGCPTSLPPDIVDGVLIWELGDCRIGLDSPDYRRSLLLKLESGLRDADPRGEDAEIRAHRTAPLTLELSSGDSVLASVEQRLDIRGPLLDAESRDPPADPVAPGDLVRFGYMLRNRGDAVLRAPRIALQNGEVFDCIVLMSDGAPDGECAAEVALPDVASGESRVVPLTARLRRDAKLDEPPRVLVELRSKRRGYALPPVGVSLNGATAPELSLLNVGGWSPAESELPTLRIGQSARLRLSGTFPAGRYTGDIRLLARAVRAQTGEPIAPATLELGEPRLELNGAPRTLQGGFERTGDDPIWARYAVPIPLDEDASQPTEPREWALEVDVSLFDDIALRRGVIVELTAEIDAGAGRFASGVSWLELLVLEPEMRLKLVSLDQDRVLSPDEPLRFVALACNYGDAPAFDVVPKLEFPQRIDANRVVSRAWQLPLASVQDSMDPLADVAALAAREVDAKPVADGNTLRIAVPVDAGIEPGHCLAVVPVIGRLQRPAQPALSESVRFALEPYRSGLNTGARIHTRVVAPPLVFRAALLRLSPTLPRRLTDGKVAHEVSISLPDDSGDLRLSLAVRSSGGMRWAKMLRGPDSREAAWRDGEVFSAGARMTLLLEGSAPERRPLGWSDTSTVAMTSILEDGRAYVSKTRVVTRDSTHASNVVTTSKRLALDRDCDGELSDEHVQDSLFEPVKDAAIGDCIVFRIGFRHAGDSDVERIAIRDRLSELTRLVEGSVDVLHSPEPLSALKLALPSPGDPVIAWTFEGLFKPGATGDVTYAVRLEENPRAGN